MICVFDIIEGPARGKRFWMRQDQTMEIGRLSTADFSIPADHHMSRHHLIVEATVDSFRVRDVGSANGTFVNNARVLALELCSGDKIRAGSSTFEVSLIPDSESPHARDGLALDVGVTDKRSSVASSGSVSVAAPQATSPKSLPRQVIALDADDEETKRPYSNCISKSVSKSPSGSTSGLNYSRVDRHVTELQSSAWWLDYFAPTKVPHVFHEAVDFENRVMDLAGLLQMLDTEFRISAVLNVEQLGRFALEVIDEWHQLSRVLDVSSKLCLISSDGSAEFWTLVRNTMRREAVIVFGSHAPLKLEWLQHMSDLLQSPTILNELLSSSTEYLRDELLEQAEFVVFEQDASGALGLLVRED
jgi:pSer/pThr/pTyr-binding forkhead associated (FHA) protein